MKLEDPIDPELARAFLSTVYARPIPEQHFERALQDSLKLPARAWRELWRGRLDGVGLSGDLRQIHVSTLLVWGERDGRATRADQDALLREIPDVRFRAYAGVGHSPAEEAPEQVASDITAFVLEVSARTGGGDQD